MTQVALQCKYIQAPGDLTTAKALNGDCVFFV